MNRQCKKILLSVIVLVALCGCTIASSKNKTMTTIMSDGNGNKQSETVSTFDKGNLVKVESETGIISYVYERGDCVQVVEGDTITNNSYKNHRLSKSEVVQKDKKIKRTIFIYDGSGNCIQKITIGQNIADSEQITMVYNDNNLLVKVFSQKVNNEITMTLNEHDSLGNVIASSTYVNEELVQCDRYEYKNKLLVKESLENKVTEQPTRIDYSYDSKDMLVEKRITENGDAKPKMIFTYRYSD